MAGAGGAAGPAQDVRRQPAGRKMKIYATTMRHKTSILLAQLLRLPPATGILRVYIRLCRLHIQNHQFLYTSMVQRFMKVVQAGTGEFVVENTLVELGYCMNMYIHHIYIYIPRMYMYI